MNKQEKEELFKKLWGNKESLDNLFWYNNLFNSKEVKEYWKKHLQEGGDPGDLYLHIPFCKSKCSYCMYPSWKMVNEDNKKDYISYIANYIKYFRKIFDGYQFSSLYIGGGTPSILSIEEIDDLFSLLFNSFSFKQKAEKTFECNPASLSIKKLKKLKELGFNRISLGVQTTDENLLKKHNRGYQDLDRIEKIIKKAKNNFLEVSVDLIANLKGGNKEAFKKSIFDISKFEPTNIIVYALHPTADYSERYLSDDLDDYYQNYSEEIEKYLDVLKEFKEKSDYLNHKELDSSNFSWGFRKENNPPKLIDYTGEFSEERSKFGIGFFSRSHIKGILEYKQSKLNFDFDEKDKTFQGRRFDQKEEIASFLFQRINQDGKIKKSELEDRFDKNAVSAFIKKIEDDDFIKVKGGELRSLESNKEGKFFAALSLFDDKKLEELQKRIYSKQTKIKNNDNVKKEWVRLTRACNNNCLFCLDQKAQNGTSISYKKIVTNLKRGINRGASQVVLSGGEPTMHPRFIEIVKKSKKLGYDHIQVISNGRMFLYEDFLEKAISAGVSEVTFSFHGHKPEIHDKLTNVDESFKQALKGLTNVLETDLIVSVDVVINKLNYKHLADIINYFIFLGVRDFDLLQIIPFGGGWQNRSDLFYDLDKAKPYLDKAFELSKSKNIHISTNRFPPQYLEGFEDIIQDPRKLLDEVRGREEMFNEFLSSGKKMSCFGRCEKCFLEDFCNDLVKFKDEKRLTSKTYPVCLSNLKMNDYKVLNYDKNISIIDFLEFYLDYRYFVKSLRCKNCKYSKDCDGMHIDYIIKNGFKSLKPKNG